MKTLLSRLRVEPENRRLLATMYFTFFTNGMMAIIFGALLPSLKDGYGLSYAQSGMLLSSHQAGNICALLLVGVLPYLLGRKKSVLLMVSGLALGMFGITLTGNMFFLVPAFVLTGLSRGTISNIANVTISEISGNKTGALNILHAVFAVGALLGPVLIYICEQGLGFSWKSAALVVAALGVAVWLLLFTSKLENEPAPKSAGGGTAFLTSPAFWINTAVLFFYICAESSIIGWFVTYFKDTGLLAPNVAQFTSTIVWLMILFGRLVCTALSYRIKKHILLLGMGVLFTGFFAGLLASTSSVTAIICLAGIGFSMAGIYPTTVASMPSTSSMLATGLSMGLAGVGGIAMPVIVGSVADSIGLAGGIAAVMVALVIMLALMIVKVVWHKKIG